MPETLSEYVWYAGREVWKGTLMVADLEQVDKIDASEFHNVKLNAKEMISPNLVTIPKTADGQFLRTSTSIGVSVPRTRRSSRRPSWRIRRVSTNHQSKKSLHINTVYTEISEILTKIASKISGKTCHELLQQADLRRLLQVKTSCCYGSWFINEFSLQLALINIHDNLQDRKLIILRLPQARLPHQPGHLQLCQAIMWLDKHGETCGDRFIWFCRYVECCRTPFLSHNFEDMVREASDKDCEQVSIVT